MSVVIIIGSRRRESYLSSCIALARVDACRPHRPLQSRGGRWLQTAEPPDFGVRGARMEAAGDEPEFCEIHCLGDEIWAPLSTFFDPLGWVERLKKWNPTAPMVEYTDWLRKVLENSGDAAGEGPWTTVPDEEKEMVGTLSLVACPLDMSRRRALRAVELPELTEKARAITLAQRWRSWDVLQISRLPHATGLEGTFLEDFHQRLCALGALFYVHWARDSPIPPFLKAMGRNIPTKYLGYASRTVALARAVQTCAAFQCGVTHLGWLDIVLQVVPVDEGHG